MFASRIKTREPTPSPQEDVQVEVCLDSKDKLYSIMVKNEATNTLQSVMAVPQHDNPTRRRSRQLQQNRYSQVKGTPVAVNRDEEIGNNQRKIDLMRNLSPIKYDRSSLFSGDEYHHRRHAQSLPPPTIRSSFSDDSKQQREKRESSCMPALDRRSGDEIRTVSITSTAQSKSNSNNNNNNKTGRPHAVTLSTQKMKKPDLVSATAARGGFLRSMRPGIRKVQDITK